MTTFLIHFFSRVISGATNGSFYHGSKNLGHLFTGLFLFLMIALPFLVSFSGLGILLLGLSSVSAIGKCRAFLTKETFGMKDIHLWGTLQMLFIPIALILSGYSILMVILSVYPGLFIHKMLINFGSNLPIFDNRTNDLTGKTFDINLPDFLQTMGFPKTINVPRTTQSFRVGIALISILAAIILNFITLPTFWIFQF